MKESIKLKKDVCGCLRYGLYELVKYKGQKGNFPEKSLDFGLFPQSMISTEARVNV